MKDSLPEINIALSGWSGAGTSTAALLLAFLLKSRYLYLGQVFRDLGVKLGYENEGKSRSDFDAFIEPIIGKTIDNYVDYKLLNDKDLVLESDLSAYRIGKHPKVFSVFLRTSQEERIKRAKHDGRKNAKEAMLERDKVLQEKYKELWDIDIFDEELIAKKYNLIIDNSKISISDEIFIILDRLRKIEYLKDETDWAKILGKIDNAVKKFTSKGKPYFRKELEKEGLMISSTEIMRDIVKLFPEDVESYPKEVQKVFLGIA